jgi:DNA recombination protein RmuC
VIDHVVAQIPKEVVWFSVVVFGAFLGFLLARAGPQRVNRKLEMLGRSIERLTLGQLQLSGALGQVAETTARAQSETAHIVATRLDTVGDRLTGGLVEAGGKTQRSLGALRERMDAIDRAQDKLEKLSADILGLQNILSNKQSRGLYGEMQLHDLITTALPAGVASFQVTLSNGRRADAVLDLPDPPGKLAIDAKFPLEPYESLVAATTPEETKAARRDFSRAVRTHIDAIAERYVAAPETADGALMFLPSEAVYAELHARFPEVVQESFNARVWIVSPTTMMATLNTIRAVLKDARLHAEARELRRDLSMLLTDLEKLGAAADKMATHFDRAEQDMRAITRGAGTALRRARRIESGADANC